jgi:hypothetical protein
MPHPTIVATIIVIIIAKFLELARRLGLVPGLSFLPCKVLPAISVFEA